jgi:hypothetical protein
VFELVRREAELTFGECSTESGQKLSAKHPAEDANREKEVLGSSDPAGSLQGQPAAGHDTMHVGVELKVLAPGVQHGQHTDLSSRSSVAQTVM